MRFTLVSVALGMTLIAAGCTASASPSSGPLELRLGYFPNVTHSAAVAGVERGTFAAALGDSASLKTLTFNAGPDAVTAILSDSLDASFVGPNPAINAFARSNGDAVRIVAGATSGGAFFVVHDGIESAADLRGKTIATPQLGNTQDVALRAWLKTQNLTADNEGGGDVAIMPQPNAQALEAFIAGQIDGAWVPEPWATRMLREGGGHVLVDERDLWPNGEYVTTLLIVRTDFIAEHRDVVKRLIKGLLESTDYLNGQPAEAQATVNTALTELTGSEFDPQVLASAWDNLKFTVDPIAASLQKSADEARELGFLESSDLDGIYDLSVLNEVLRESGRPQVAQP